MNLASLHSDEAEVPFSLLLRKEASLLSGKLLDGAFVFGSKIMMCVSVPFLRPLK